MAKLISKIYGDALFESAKDRGNLDQIYEEVIFLDALFPQNPELLKILESPKISKEEKIDTMKAIFSERVSDLTMGFLVNVIEKNRQKQVHEIFEHIISEVKEYKKIGIAYISSAIELNAEQKEAIVQKLIATTKYEIFEMHYEVNPDLLGGIRIRIKDRVVDSTIKSRIYDIKKELLSVQMK